jgi:hypothetical protein
MQHNYRYAGVFEQQIKKTPRAFFEMHEAMRDKNVIRACRKKILREVWFNYMRRNY